MGRKGGSIFSEESFDVAIPDDLTFPWQHFKLRGLAKIGHYERDIKKFQRSKHERTLMSTFSYLILSSLRFLRPFMVNSKI